MDDTQDLRHDRGTVGSLLFTSEVLFQWLI